MRSEHWQQIEGLFHAALEREPSERAAFLSEACGDNISLRSAIESLLTHHEQADSFIESSAFSISAVLGEQPESLVGKTFGNYRVLEMLGEGGMGQVYLAQDNKLGRKVALKFLARYFTQEKDRLRRFEQEARAASALNHPNIITIYEIGEAEAHHFIATEFIDGQTLRERMKRTPMNLSEVLEVAVQTASALAAAHAAGIAHRDIKPENIMVRRDGIVKVLDFGLAKLAAPESALVEAEGASQALYRTDPGIILGTTIYMSPEQARGLQVDARTDIFSLGVLLYEMVAGCLPFAGSTPSEVLASILSEKEPQPLARYSRDVPAELERIVSKALRKDREQRYQTVKDLMLDLQSLKQQIEFELRLERSTAPDPKIATGIASGPSAVEASTRSIGRATSKVEQLTGALMMRRRAVIATALVIILLAVALGYALLFRKTPATTNLPEIKSLAVLPLQNLSRDAEQDYFADGMTEALTAELSKISALKVISRTSAMQYKGAKKPLPEIARELGVDGLIEGSVLREGNQVRITVQLMHGPSDRHLWAESYQRELRGILALQSEVAQAIGSQIRVVITPGERDRLAATRPVDPEVQELFWRGRFYLRKQPWRLYWTKGRDYLEQAIARDPSYAPAHAGLADTYSRAALYDALAPQEAWPKAEASARRALELDDNLAEAHAVLGVIRLERDWNWQEAERELQRALDLNPNSPDVHSWHALYLTLKGKLDESVSESKRAQELDPLRVDLNLVFRLMFARRYDEAIEQGRRSLELEPNIEAHAALASVYELKGMEKEAAEETIRALTGRRDTALTRQFEQIYKARGYRAAARFFDHHIIEDELQKSPPNSWILAFTYARLGEKDKAFEWLEKAYEERNPGLLQVRSDPDVDSLREDPRFADLLRRLALPQ